MIRRWLDIRGWMLLLLLKDWVVAEAFTLGLLAVLASRMCFVALEDCGPVMSVDEVCATRGNGGRARGAWLVGKHGRAH